MSEPENVLIQNVDEAWDYLNHVRELLTKSLDEGWIVSAIMIEVIVHVGDKLYSRSGKYSMEIIGSRMTRHGWMRPGTFFMFTPGKNRELDHPHKLATSLAAEWPATIERWTLYKDVLRNSALPDATEKELWLSSMSESAR